MSREIYILGILEAFLEKVRTIFRSALVKYNFFVGNFLNSLELSIVYTNFLGAYFMQSIFFCIFFGGLECVGIPLLMSPVLYF